MRNAVLLTLIALSAFFGFAQNNYDAQEIFTAKVDSTGNQNILYREAIIHPELSDSAVLVVYLHGAGGRGSDNISHVGTPAVKAIYDYLDSHNIHAYFIAPQCPENAAWNGGAPERNRPGKQRRVHSGNRNGQPGHEAPYIRYIMPFIKNYAAGLPISNSRIYLLGASMGAAGVWGIIADNPRFFAAAMTASGTYSGKNLTSLTHTPIISTVGTEERSYNKNKTNIEALAEAGANVTFIPLKGLGHVEACNEAFTEETLNLLFSTHR